MIRFEYEVADWRFREYAEEVLGVRELERLHELPVPQDIIDRSYVDSRFSPAVSLAQHGLMLSARLRASLTPAVIARFEQFVHEVMPPLTGPVLRHQRDPVFRVHMHGGHSISGFHRDRDWGQASNVVNLWLPFTDVWGSNSIWIESDEGAGDHQPVALKYGQGLIFHAADLSHGSVRNSSGVTRVSCDVRFAVRFAAGLSQNPGVVTVTGSDPTG